MSENVSIQESGKTRNFSGVGVIETETPEGESCFWVPESERELETEYVIKNGTYRPKKYGFSELNVNVTELIGDFEITIDDVGLPHIDIGDIDVSIDLDGMPVITIDGETIELPDISADIDLDADIDISLDVGQDGDIDLDLVGADMDGDGIYVNIDLDDLDIDIEDCPASISILSRPASLVYTAGDTLDFTGLAVEVLDKDGMPWPDPEAGTWTEIPFDELVINQTKADISQATSENVIINGNIPGTAVGDGAFFETVPPSPETLYKTLTGYVKIVSLEGGVVYLVPPQGEDSSPARNGLCVAPGKGVSYNITYYDDEGKLFGVNYYPLHYPIDYDSIEMKGANVPVTVQWVTPCFETLETSFNITVYPKGGSHHSGKF